MKKLLYIDANVNRATSRTERLAQALLDRLRANEDIEVTTLVLEDEGLAPLNSARLNLRTAGTAAGDFSDPVFAYAKQFAAVDEVVIAAPYWDFSFPTLLKNYLELLCAQGVTFTYSDEGVPTGLVRATRAWYVTTAGGYCGDYDFGWAQVDALCRLYFGIPDVRRFSAEGLDIVTNDVDAIMADALHAIESEPL